MEGRYTLGSKHCSFRIPTVARKNFTYIITSRRSGEGTSSQGFWMKGGRERQVGPLAPGIALRLHSYRCQESPLNGVRGETGVICVVQESVQEKGCKCTANFFSSLTKLVFYVEILTGSPGLLKANNFTSNFLIIHHSDQTGIQSNHRSASQVVHAV